MSSPARSVRPGEPALDEVAARFGGDVIQADGTLDRARLGNDRLRGSDARRDLEQITHPRIFELTQERVAAALAGDGAARGRRHPAALRE